MRAAVLTAYKEPLDIEDVERPTPEPDGVVAEVDACGVRGDLPERDQLPGDPGPARPNRVDGPRTGGIHRPPDRHDRDERDPNPGSSGIPRARYGEIFDMVRTGKLDPAAVVTDHIGLDGLNRELEAMTDYETVGIPVVDEFA